MPARSSSTRRLSVESLEGRSLLAGNVVAVQTEDLLTVLGDGSANCVSIIYDQAAGKHLVAGHVLDGSPTQINGSTASSEFSGIKKVQVLLGGGNDMLEFGDSTRHYTEIQGKLTVDMGDGNDTVELGTSGYESGGGSPRASRVYVKKGIDITLGDGNDTLAIANLKTGKSLIVSAGEGNDTVEFATEFTPAGATEPKKFPVQVKGNVHINLGGGDDTLSARHVAVGINFKITDPAGPANLSLFDVGIDEKLDIATGDAVDQVILDFVAAEHLNLHTNGGADDIEIEHSRFKRMNIKTGAGHDDLTVRTSRSSQYAVFDGGQGGANYVQRRSALHGLVKRRM